MRGVIDRRILANYRIDPAVAAVHLPAPFKPKLVDGFAIGGLCLIRLKQVRPSVSPIPIGVSSENAAHRIAVTWQTGREKQEGVYIPRRDTNSRINVMAGGRLFPGEHHHAVFSVDESATEYDVAFESRDRASAMRIRARVTDAFAADSVFSSLEDASAFFEAGSLGYSATQREGRFDGLELDCHSWSVTSLLVEEVASSFFDEQSLYPEGSIAFDHALLMRGIDHQWHQRGAMCCDAGALKSRTPPSAGQARRLT